MKTTRTQHLQAIVDILNANNYGAGLGDDVYLIRYNHPEEKRNNLALMSDYGITWEPNKAYPTPEMGRITAKDPQTDAKIMMTIADKYNAGHPSQSTDEHLWQLPEHGY